MAGGYRWMYYATGLPGWMRFGFSPGWIGRSPNGLGPCATYLLTGQWPAPVPSLPFTGTYPSVAGTYPALGGTLPVSPTAPVAGALGTLGNVPKEQQVSILENQAKLLEDQLKAIQKRLSELKSES